MNRNQTIEQLLETLGNLMRLVGKHVNASWREHALRRPQMITMFIVSRAKTGITPKQLAHDLGVSGAAVSQSVDELVRQGLLKRRVDPTDRRSIKLLTTAKASATFKHFQGHYFELVAPLFDNLSDAELAQLQHLFTKINLTALTKREADGK